MAHSRWRRLTPLAVALLASASCRSILDIEPGRPLDETGASAGKASGGKSSTSAGGMDDSGGEAEPDSGGKSGGAGKGSGGTSKGGSAQAGTTSEGGDGMGGAGPNGPVSPFPEGVCRDCMARNCATQEQACADDATCADGIAEWLACAEADANACVSPDAGALQDVAACGAKSCDVCRHLTDSAPSVEILTPSNGAAFALDDSGLIEVAVRVRNVNVKGAGQCAADDTSCGHVHLNLDEVNCRTGGFYNSLINSVDAGGNAEGVITTTVCMTSILDRPLELRASLSTHNNHMDRVPLVQSTVTITLSE
jgi:hypothetical protein